MPIILTTKSSHAEMRCLECNEAAQKRRPFCSDVCQLQWLETHKPWHRDWRGAMQVEAERQRRGITPAALDWKWKLNLSRGF